MIEGLEEITISNYETVFMNNALKTLQAIESAETAYSICSGCGGYTRTDASEHNCCCEVESYKGKNKELKSELQSLKENRKKSEALIIENHYKEKRGPLQKAWDKIIDKWIKKGNEEAIYPSGDSRNNTSVP